MEENPPLTPYDTVETIASYLAYSKKVPRDMIIINNADSPTPSFLNAEDIIKENYKKIPLRDIDIFLRSKTNKYWRKKIVDTVVYLTGQELESLDSSLENIAKNDKAKHTSIAKKSIEIINNFYKTTRFSKSFNIKSMAANYEQLVKSRKNEEAKLEKSNDKMNYVFSRYDEAMRNPVLKSSELVTVSQNLRFSIIDSETGVMPDKEAIFTIFDDLVCTSKISHILCRDSNGNFYQKQFEVLPYEKPIPYTSFLDKNKYGNDKSTITFTYLSGKSVFILLWNVELGYIEINELPEHVRENMLADLKSFLNKYVIESTSSSRIYYEMRLYPIVRKKFSLKEHILMHRLVREPEIFQYYINETTSAYPYKKAEELIFRYAPIWNIPNVTEKDEVEFRMSLGNTASETNCIVLSIVSETEIGVFRLLSCLIPSLSIYFKEDIMEKSPYEVLYKNIPNMIPEYKKIRNKEKQQLYDEFPEVFTYNYLYGGKDNDRVQKRDLVRVTVDKDLAKAWKKETIEKAETSIDRPVEAFYDTEGKIMFWYTSLKNDTPYLRLVENTRDENPKYPFIPASSTAESHLVKDEFDVTNNKPISSLLALKVFQKTRRLGLLPSSCSSILPNCYRLGMTVGPNAFLECVLHALDKSTKPKNIAAVRRDIAKTILPERLKQQFYNFENEDITNKLADVDFPLDPYFFIAALEEYFSIDIYVIVPKTEFNLITTKIMVPAHYQFYCRHPEIRKCVIVFSNHGVDSDRLLYNHSELIYEDDDGDETKLFPESMSLKMRNIWNETLVSMISTDNGLFATRFLTLNPKNFLGDRKPLYQYIDGYGKCRALTFQEDDKLFCAVFAATEPFNLPSSKDVVNSKFADVRKLFPGKIVGRAVNEGIWIEHKEEIFNTILYFRIEDMENVPEDTPFLGVDPIIVADTKGENAIVASAYKQKDFVIITELIYWLMDNYAFQYRNEGKFNYKFFLEERVTYTKKKVDEDNYYGILAVRQTLPEVSSFKKAFAFASQVFPVVKGKIVLHNKAFYEKIAYLLSKHQRSVKMVSSVRNTKIIPNFYRSIYDFKQYPQNVVRTENVDVRLLTRLGTQVAIADEVVYRKSYPEPILYMQNDVLYCIQNTILEDFGSAYRVSLKWKEERQNEGYNVKSVNTPLKDLDFILYKVNLGSIKAVYASDKALPDSPLILDYGNKKYAALLKV